MANKKTVKRRRSKKKKQTVLPFAQRNFPQEIIKHLEGIGSISGHGNSIVFSDWLRLTEATLKALPDQIRAVGATGHFAEDPPETGEAFAQVRSRYSADWLGEDRCGRAWQHFAAAFALLLEATAPGLWGEPNSLGVAGISGPDVLGYIYQEWANPAASRWHGEYMSPWPVALLMAKLTVGVDGERQIHERLKKALSHPDNILGAAVLLAGLVIPEDEPDVARDHFFTHILPAALPFYDDPLLCNDPAVGTGILLLGSASVLPAYAVHYGLARFTGQDINVDLARAASIQSMVYGLNAFSCNLTHSFAVNARVCFQ